MLGTEYIATMKKEAQIQRKLGLAICISAATTVAIIFRLASFSPAVVATFNAPIGSPVISAKSMNVDAKLSFAVDDALLLSTVSAKNFNKTYRILSFRGKDYAPKLREFMDKRVKASKYQNIDISVDSYEYQLNTDYALVTVKATPTNTLKFTEPKPTFETFAFKYGVSNYKAVLQGFNRCLGKPNHDKAFIWTEHPGATPCSLASPLSTPDAPATSADTADTSEAKQ